MEHAGVAISITTLTDLVAFAIASFSSKIFFVRLARRCTLCFCFLNHVHRTFCYFAILSLSFVYLYICTFFLAALAIDQRRMDAGRC